jgi:hypothetical protein
MALDYITTGWVPIRSRRDTVVYLVYVPSNGVIGHVDQNVLHWPVRVTVAILADGMGNTPPL